MCCKVHKWVLRWRNVGARPISAYRTNTLVALPIKPGHISWDEEFKHKNKKQHTLLPASLKRQHGKAQLRTNHPHCIVDELYQQYIYSLRFEFRTYATISRAWQCVVEAYTFKRVVVKSTDLAVFSAAYSPENARHRAITRRPHYRVYLPTRGN
jgi:hypothetical protein